MLIAKRQQIGNFLKLHVGLTFHQSAGLLNAKPGVILDKRNLCCVLDHSADIRRANVKFHGNVVDRQWRVFIQFYVIVNLLEQDRLAFSNVGLQHIEALSRPFRQFPAKIGIGLCLGELF